MNSKPVVLDLSFVACPVHLSVPSLSFQLMLIFHPTRSIHVDQLNTSEIKI